MPKKPDLNLIVTEDGSHSLSVPELDETYHSSHGAIQESNHVFIKHGLLHWAENNPGKPIKIFEVGFGTGLNAFLTAIEADKKNIQVQYQSIELYPIDKEFVGQLNYPAQLEESSSLFEALHQASWEESIKINETFNLFKTKGSLIDFEFSETYDLIYFDAFAPSKQPELWEYPIIEKCYNALNKNGIFVTYSAKGQLKRDLKKAGFKLETLPGPPGKFEMVRAIKRS